MTLNQITKRITNKSKKLIDKGEGVCVAKKVKIGKKTLIDKWTCDNPEVEAQNLDPNRQTLSQEDVQKTLYAITSSSQHHFDVMSVEIVGSLNVPLVGSLNVPFVLSSQIKTIHDMIVQGTKGGSAIFYVNIDLRLIDMHQLNMLYNSKDLTVLPLAVQRVPVIRHVVAFLVKPDHSWCIWDCNGPNSQTLYYFNRVLLHFAPYLAVSIYQKNLCVNHINFDDSYGIGHCSYYTAFVITLLVQNPTLTLQDVSRYVETITGADLAKFIKISTYIADSL